MTARARSHFGPLVLAGAVAACAAERAPCASAGACERGSECLAMRCVREGALPVAGDTTRLLALPASLAVASDAERTSLGPSVTLGSPVAPRARLYVGFEPVWQKGRVHAAFLLLEPVSGSAAGADVELEVARARRAWSGSAMPWSGQPGPTPPMTRGIARGRPPLPVRIDVTELVRLFAERPKQAHGFVVGAAGETPAGISLSTGLDGGAPPRLDVYLAN